MAALVPANFGNLTEGRDVTTDIFIGLFDLCDQDSLSIEPATSQLLAEKNLPIVFDFYVGSTLE